jgi:hypothetical protein
MDPPKKNIAVRQSAVNSEFRGGGGNRESLHDTGLAMPKNSGPIPAIAMLWDQKNMKAEMERGQLSAFAQDCITAGFEKKDVAKYIEMMVYLQRLWHWQQMDVSQRPKVVALSSSKKLNVNRMFGDELEVRDGVAIGGAAGPVADLKPHERNKMLELGDFVSLSVLQKYMKENLKELAPYIPCVGLYDPMHDSMHTFEAVARMQMERLGMVAEEAVKSGHMGRITCMTGGLKGIKMWNVHGKEMMLLPMVVDVPEKKAYVVWEGEGGTVSRMEFHDLMKALDLSEHEECKRHIDSIHEYMEELEIHAALSSNHDIMCCIDLRNANNTFGKFSEIERRIGGVPTDEELRDLVFGEKEGMVMLHTDCGYMTKLLDMHIMLKSLASLGGSEDVVVSEAVSEVHKHLNTVFSGNTVALPEAEIAALADILGLQGRALETFGLLFHGSPLHEKKEGVQDIQKLAHHMYERGLIRRTDEWFKVPEAEKAELKLPHDASPTAASDNFLYLLTEQIGWQIKDRINRMRGEKEGGQNVEVMIESMTNGGIFALSEEGNGPGRKMMCGISDDGAFRYAAANPLEPLGREALLEMFEQAA